jgi:predicted RNA-binding Zn-ribbon protein involved in translation (DUF1610 family)
LRHALFTFCVKTQEVLCLECSSTGRDLFICEQLTTFSCPPSSDAANRFEIHRRHSSRVRAIAAPHQRAVSRLICMKQRFSHSRGSASKARRHQAWRAIILMSNNTERVDRLGGTFTLITQHLSARLKKRLIGID